MNSRYSVTAISGYRGTVSGMYPTLRRTSNESSTTSKPATVALPPEGGMKPVRIRMVVVLPAPLGPRNPRFHRGGRGN
jgi:hypothetical protein